MSGIRLLGRYRVIAVTMALTALLLVAIIGVMLATRTSLRPLNLDLPARYRPGQVLDSTQPHFREYYRSYTSVTGYVERASDTLDYIIELDMPVRTIRHVSKWIYDSHITLGDLILRWGPPTGKRGSFVEWQDRSAFLTSDDGLFPSDEVYFITFGMAPEDLEPWNGFTSDKPETSSLSLRGLAGLFPLRP